MKKVIAFLFLFIHFLTGRSQDIGHYEYGYDEFLRSRKDRNIFNTRVQILDSIVGYYQSSQSGSFYEVGVTILKYNDQLKCTSMHGIAPLTRENVYFKSYKYDQAGNNTEYLYQEWTGSEWKDIRLWQYFYNLNNELVKEYNLAKTSAGGWYPYQQIFYYYENGKTTNHLRQNRNSDGSWYDSARHYYIYNASGKLINLFGEYVNNKIVFWSKTYEYYEDGSLKADYLKILRYNPLLKRNELVNSACREYFYDIYGDISEVFDYSWNENEWKFKAKSVYFYSLIPNRKINLCHNGHEIQVSAHAVKAHLEHGDKLGRCPAVINDAKQDEFNINEDPGHKAEVTPLFSVYPNPATSFVNIDIKNKTDYFEYGYLMSPGGSIISTFDVRGKSLITVSMDGLMPGSYIISLAAGGRRESVNLVLK